MRFISLLLFLVSTTAHSACWTVGDFKGYSAKKGADYNIGIDGLTGQKFSVHIAGEASAVIPSSDLECKQLATHSIACTFSEGGRGTVEIWAVDPEQGVAYYTKSSNGFGIFDGPVLFVGEVKGKCR